MHRATCHGGPAEHRRWRGSVHDHLDRCTESTLLSNALNMQVIVDQDASYVVTVTDACDGTATATVNTFVPQYAPMVLSLTEDTVLCNGGSILLEAEA